MILEKTVFILGSGASCHLGYPLGSELWKKVADYLSPIKDLGKIPKGEAITEKERKKNRELLLKFGFLEEDIQEFCTILYKYSPYNLDEFLENNQKYRKLAKVAIAQVLIPYEDDGIIAKQQDWYQKLFEKMKTTVDKFHENNITFISFNYDRSLEQYLFHKLKYSQVDKASECAGAINRLTFIHVYGQLGNLPWQGREGRAYKKNYNLEELRNAASGITTAHEQAKNFEIIDNIFKNAKRILFLGFGFDEFNLRNLNLLPWVDGTKSITGTVYGLARDRTREIETYFNEKNYKIVLRDMKIIDFLYDINLS